MSYDPWANTVARKAIEMVSDPEQHADTVAVPRKTVALVISVWSGYLDIAGQRKFYPPTSHNAIVARELLAELQALIDGLKEGRTDES